MLMLSRVYIVLQDVKNLEVQNLWTSVMLRAKYLSLQTTSGCRSATAIRNRDTSPTSVVTDAQCLETERTDRPFAKKGNRSRSNDVAKSQQRSRS